MAKIKRNPQQQAHSDAANAYMRIVMARTKLEQAAEMLEGHAPALANHIRSMLATMPDLIATARANLELKRHAAEACNNS